MKQMCFYYTFKVFTEWNSRQSSSMIDIPCDNFVKFFEKRTSIAYLKGLWLLLADISIIKLIIEEFQ